MGCCCNTKSTCFCNAAGTSFYNRTLQVSFTGVTIPTGSCLTGFGGVQSNFTSCVLNSDPTFCVPLFSSPTGANCTYRLTDTSSAAADYLNACTTAQTGLITEISTSWTTGIGTVITVTVTTRIGSFLLVSESAALSLTCGGSQTFSNNATANLGAVVFGGTFTVTDVTC